MADHAGILIMRPPGAAHGHAAELRRRRTRL